MKEPPDRIDTLAHDVIGVAIEVHDHLGPGYLESVYEEAMHRELELRHIPFESQYTFDVDYKNAQVGRGRIDVLVDEELVVEMKAVKNLKRIHGAQTLSYLRALELPLGILINFNVPLLKDGLQRVVDS